ncbi:MAG: class I SAM-dependent methyltransferase [Solirubrobacterales bacterium]|nr:class I SAM-dependent methyltransferase [Solirubrobacterales bacterium]MBV9472123.1 class I SAM-dependent methyltransferase [Solirubrobacterales bacterium]
MPGRHLYVPEYYENVERSAERSARSLLPIVLELLRPRSVCDVGCGTGVWLRVFGELGVSDVVGIDAPTVPRRLLKISEQRFHATDLAREDPVLGRTFDLAMSLEVAEHLPADRAARLVSTLTSLAPVVMFGAAIPGQGGTSHLNEQWPDYWAKLFEQHDYAALDVLRHRVWGDPQVEYWYAQNTFLYVRRDRLRDPALESAISAAGSAFPVRAVHPGLLGVYAAEHHELVARAIPARQRLTDALRRRLRRIAPAR